MDPDDYQRAWQTHTAQTRVSFDTNALLQLARLDQQGFRSSMLWNDFFAGAIALFLLPLWIFLGVTLATPWTWYLTVPVLIWNVVFMLLFRTRHQRRPVASGEPLRRCVEESLSQVEDEIWLQRNYLWWNLLPFVVSVLTFAIHSTWLRSDGLADMLSNGSVVVFLMVVFGLVYVVHQKCGCAKFEPRRQELLALLSSLDDETGKGDSSSAVSESVTRLAEQRLTTQPTPAQIAIAVGGVAVAFTLAGLFMFYIFETEIKGSPSFTQRSPFEAVRWQDYRPEVMLDDEWYRLESLDELPADEIVAFSRRTYRNRWRKRFEEDLVELLTGMKHPPGDTVDLVVESLTSTETVAMNDVPMTSANRNAIRNAAAARANELPEPAGEERPAVPIDDRELFARRIDEFLERAQVRTGFSGVVLVARGGQPIYQGSVGYAHLASRIPNTADTSIRIASLSKQFTAAAVLLLEAEGKLSTDDPVHRYLAEFDAEPYRDITIYHLLTHTSGLPRTPEDEARHARWDAMAEAPTPAIEYVRLACQCPLQFEPGEDFQYSNFGYRILSALIEAVTDQEYADFMEQRLFEPFGLRDSGVARVDVSAVEAKIAEVVSFDVVDGGTRQATFVPTDEGRNYGTGYGSGGIYSSANDLLRWDRVLAGDELLPPEQKGKLFRPFRDNYACGWTVKESALDGRLYHAHSGSNGGYFSRMMRIPADDLVIIALGNAEKTDEIDEALDQLFRLCRSLPYRDP